MSYLSILSVGFWEIAITNKEESSQVAAKKLYLFFPSQYLLALYLSLQTTTASIVYCLLGLCVGHSTSACAMLDCVICLLEAGDTTPNLD